MPQMSRNKGQLFPPLCLLIVKMLEDSGHSTEHSFIEMLMRVSVNLYTDCTENNFLLIKFSQGEANSIHLGVNKIILFVLSFFFFKKRYTSNNGLLWVFLFCFVFFAADIFYRTSL